MAVEASGSGRQWGVAVVVLIASIALGWFLRERRSTDQIVARASSPSLRRQFARAGSPSHADRGELLYRQNCAKCHGAEGHGDAEGAERLRPPPRDFAARPWRFAVSRESILRVVREGIPGTSMPATRVALPDDDLDRLAEHVLRLSTLTPLSLTPDEQRLRAAGFFAVENRPAPPLDLVDANGRTESLANLRGRVVLINFWGLSCGPCLERLPQVVPLAARFEPLGLTVLNVCADADDAREAQDVAERVATGATAFVDATGLANARYGVQVLPTVVLVDRAGRLLAQAHEVRPWMSPEMQAVLETYLTRGP